MATAHEVNEANAEAQLALLKKIQESVTSERVAPSAISEWALAYRYLRGGAQPGSATVEK
ncbi:hypothetical protein SAMN02800687_2760 [Curtobacterium sp. UNCCL20]|jgi:hypothetical protein|uniref:hypothetical protein n=1 Tax=Curtobacterium sp. UNCCL20 TaxID=1502773 RepID=UPI00088C0E29|nr:hypothetical protein [Curtobacterium sp. UNCCL20]SDQ83285.1 hypothetical protein SAMN02800687_2760 [Curtobacterium sp. UNCCL20]